MKALKITILSTSIIGIFLIPIQLFSYDDFSFQSDYLLRPTIIISVYLLFLLLLYIYIKNNTDVNLDKIKFLKKDNRNLKKIIKIKKLEIKIKKTEILN